MIEIHPRHSDATIDELDTFIAAYNVEMLTIRNLSALALRYKLMRDPDTAAVYQEEADRRTLALPS